MKNKKLKILFLYPNLNMSTLVPNAIMKTFVLYARLPRSYWKNIKIAEAETSESIEKYNELMNLYKKEYKQVSLARD